MKKTLIVSLLAAFAAILPANAVIISSVQIDVDGAPGDVTFEGFDDGPQSGISIPGGTLDYDGAVIVQNITNGDGAIPFPTGNGDYLSVKSGGNATFNFTSPMGSFGFQWGSIDSYNSIVFSLGAIEVGSFTGDDIINPANGNQLSGGSAFVTFGGSFDKVVLSSSQNSFEIDNVSVPDGGTTLVLLGLGLAGVAFARRKQTGE